MHALAVKAAALLASAAAGTVLMTGMGSSAASVSGTGICGSGWTHILQQCWEHAGVVNPGQTVTLPAVAVVNDGSSPARYRLDLQPCTPNRGGEVDHGKWRHRIPALVCGKPVPRAWLGGMDQPISLGASVNGQTVPGSDTYLRNLMLHVPASAEPGRYARDLCATQIAAIPAHPEGTVNNTGACTVLIFTVR